MHPVEFAAAATDGTARTGTATTARGAYTTPCFMPVGTRGAVKYLSADDYARLGVEVVLGNAYHLMLRPGPDAIAAAGGLGAFSGWDGLTLTDSGGYQVFSLAPKVDDEGVTFRSTYDGSTHRLTPEDAVDIQQRIGADIQMALDVCPPLPSPPDVIALAVKRTALWAARARVAHRRQGQALFGIVQGGVDEALRRESAERIAELDFDGYAIGGLSVGETRAEMLPALAAAVEVLPADRPRYVMGVGDPAAMVEAIGIGVDQFDCVMQTRLGRHGTALTAAGRLRIKAARHGDEDLPLDETCRCEVCRRHTRRYLRHLFSVGEPTASRLVSIHNIAWTLQLIVAAREAVAARQFDRFRAAVLSVWG